MTRNNLRYAGAVWTSLVVALSLQPLRLRATSHGAGHVFLHIGLFGFAAVFPLLLSESLAQQTARSWYVLCLAIAIEIAQGVIYRQHTEWTDVQVDGIGILIAFLVIRLCRIRQGWTL